MTNRADLISYAMLITLAAIFGSNFLMTKIAVQELEPLTIVTIRLAIAAAVLMSIMLVARTPWPDRRMWLPLVLTALFGHTLPYFLITWGQEVVDAGLAVIFMAIMPLFTIVLAHIVTDDEKLTPWLVTGFAIALAGVVILFGVDKLLKFDGTSLRQYALLAAALCYGTNAVLTRQLRGMPWQTMAGVQTAFAFGLTVPLVIGLGLITALPDGVSTGVALSVVYTGLFPTALGAVMIFLIVERAGASFLSQINFLVPLFGVAFALVFGGESLPGNAILALLLILIGVALSRRQSKPAIRPVNKGA